MRSIKRKLRAFFVISAVVLSCVLVLGGPLLKVIPVSAKDQAPQQQQRQQRSKTFIGTVIKSSGDYALRDAYGQMCKLDDAKRVKPYEGKSVKVTGQLDERAMVIHVESIEASGE